MKYMKYGSERVDIEYQGLQVSGDIIAGDWEGDPSIPNGKHTLDPYVDDLCVTTLSGWEHTENLTKEFLRECEERLLNEPAVDFGDEM